MLITKYLSPDEINDINTAGQFIKVMNCEGALRVRALAGADVIVDTEARAGFEMQTSRAFSLIQLTSEQPQKVELWASQHKLSYDALTKGSNTNQSALIEHYGGSQRVLPFEQNRVAVTLFSDTEPFWYGGEGVTVENGIPVKAGEIARIEGAGEMHIAIDKRPVQVLGANETAFNDKLTVYGHDPYDYGHQSPDQTAIIATAKAQYFIESIVDGSENINATRISSAGVKIMNELGKAVDMITTNYDADEIAVLLSSGTVIRYRDGVEYNRINSFGGINWRRIGYDGVDFYLLRYESTGVSGFDKVVYKTSNPNEIAFFSDWNFSKFYFDEFNKKLMAIATHPFSDTNIVEIPPSLSGQVDSFINALGAAVDPSHLQYNTHVRIFQSSTHIVFNMANGALIYNKQENRQVFSTEGRQITPISNGLIHSVSEAGQKVSYDDGVSFTVINDYGVPAARTYGTFVDGFFVYHSIVRDENNLYRARKVEAETLQIEQTKIRMLKEVV